MNPYILIGAALLWLVSLAGTGYGMLGVGKKSQKVVDQVQFDKVNSDLTKQKADANRLYQQAQADIIKAQAERDEFKTQLGVQREASRKVTDDLRGKYAAISLRFSAPKSAGDRGNCGSAIGTAITAASPAAAAVIQLPDEIAGNLRQLTADADKLRDDYALCYAYAMKDSQ